MIQILLPETLAVRLERELRDVGDQEVGGVLMGEHVKKGAFRIVDFTVQRHGGTWFSFVRFIQDSLKRAFKNFFRSTNYQYTKFNYLGEWHSHPSFSLQPSRLDQQSMWEIVNDPDVGANFAILLIVKLKSNKLQGSVKVFTSDSPMLKGNLIRETQNNER
jgi:proteasome lid subunit RPN8/RPN11